MINAIEFIRELKCCVDCLDKVDVQYINDLNSKKNLAILVGGGVAIDEITFTIDIRSIPNKGKSAEDVAEVFLKLNNTYYNFESGNYIMYVGNQFRYNGIDDKQRMSLTNDITIKEV